MANPSGYYIMDGLDLWTAYGVFIEKGTDDFLILPERKESITYDWPDLNGLSIDTDTPVFREKEVELHCAIVASSEANFWTQYNAFKNALIAPGQRSLEVTELSQTFDVVYMKCTSFTRFTRLKTVSMIAAKFRIVFLVPDSPEPLTEDDAPYDPLLNEDDNQLYG
jgi:hypothetical protein